MRPLSRLVWLASAWLLAAGSAQAAGVSEALRARMAEQGRMVVIVELDENVAPEGFLPGPELVRAQRQRVVARQIEAIYDLGGTDAGAVRPYASVPYLAVPVGPSGLEALAASPRVRSVRESRHYGVQLTQTIPIVQADQAAAIGFDGTGQTVVVLDTGTDGGHQNFPAGKIVDEACFADGATAGGFPQGGGLGDCPGGGDTAFGAGAGAPCDFAGGCFHGTHVAGIAVGQGPPQGGVAPGASLVPIQIFSEFPGSTPGCGGSPCARAWQHDHDAALEHVWTSLRFSHTVAAVNMSLGADAYEEPCDALFPSTKAVIDNLRSVGIATVIATGNNSCSGVGCTDAQSSPSCISSSVSVSASRDSDFPATFANRSSFTSFYAPGQNVVAPLYETVSQYQDASGTSAAAPHVAGGFAILKQASPASSVSSLVAVLEATGKTVGNLGTQRINLRDALGALGFPECDDGIDNDGDGTVDTGDPGCTDAADLSERSVSLPCDDGLDNDGDGWVDLADPGCGQPAGVAEDPACDDGIDNDGDGGIDWDGSPPDAQCTSGHIAGEAASACGLGAELLGVLPLLWAARRRRAARWPAR